MNEVSGDIIYRILHRENADSRQFWIEGDGLQYRTQGTRNMNPYFNLTEPPNPAALPAPPADYVCALLPSEWLAVLYPVCGGELLLKLLVREKPSAVLPKTEWHWFKWY